MFRSLIGAPLLVCSLLVCAPGPALAQERAIPSTKEQITLSFAPVVKKATPAVVNIFTERRVATRVAPLFNDPFFQRFFGSNPEAFGMPRERVERSLGSGVIVRPNGVVVTNHHVAAGAEQIRVVLADRREFQAKVVGSDERTDLAVLQLQGVGDPLPFLEVDTSDQVEVGDLVLAIGNPFGVGQTVTSGIVSALARTNVGVSDFGSFIQTDAAINPGNSGGALITSDGRLIGINTAIYSRDGGNVGIGFAIPADMVRTVVASILKEGRAVRAWLGATGEAVTADLARNLGLQRPVGVAITRVVSGSPAQRAGLKAGDVVVAVNGRAVGDDQELRYVLATLQIGGTAELTVNREGTERRIGVALIAPPETPPRATTTLGGRQPFAGATVSNLNPAMADELGIVFEESVVLVTQVAPGSIAARLGVRPGDVILDINERPVKSVADLGGIIQQPVAVWVASLNRGGRILKLTAGN